MKKLLFLTFILFPTLLFCQQYEIIGIDMFVAATSGIRVRELPSLDSRIVTVIEYGQRIQIDGRTLQKDTIDGINDYWYMFYKGNDKRWVFGGYLTDRFDSKPIVGFWAEENNIRIGWIFTIDGNFRTGLKDSGHGEWGTYELDENNTGIFVFNYYRDELVTYSREVKIEFINNNRVKIIINNNEKILIRDNRR